MICPVISPALNSLLSQENGRDHGDYVLLGGATVGLRHRVSGRTAVRLTAGVEDSRSVDTRATPATGTYRPNPALGSGTWGVGAIELERASGGIAVHQDLQGRIRLEGGTGPDDYARVTLEGRWLTTVARHQLVSRVYLATATEGVPAYRSFVLGGRGTLLGEPFRAYGGREMALGQVEWRFEVPIPAVPLGSFASTGPRLTVAPFIALGAAGRPIAGLPWDASDGVRPVAGVALEWFMRLIRVEAGIGLRDRRFRAHGGRQSGLVGVVVALLSSAVGPAARPAVPHNRQSRSMQFTDEWLVHTIEPLLPDGTIAAIRQEPASAPGPLWEILVQRKLLADQDVLQAIAKRFRIPVADLAKIDPKLAAGGSRAGGPAVQRGARTARPTPTSRSPPPTRSTSTPRRCSPSRPGAKCGCCSARRRTIRERLDELYRNERRGQPPARGHRRRLRRQGDRRTRSEAAAAPKRRASGRSSGWWT